jgi:tetratricopeptide (TPR) repeat protein
MSATTGLSSAAADVAAAGTCRIIEAERGPRRRHHIEELLAEAASRGAQQHWVSCRLETGGPWAGLADILRALLPDLERTAPELLRKHSYELALALPELRRRFPLTEASLTDASPVKERIRSYPVDRAYRLLHGLIDLLDTWLPHLGKRLFVVCDDFDGAGALMRRFFRELARRRLSRLPLDLVFVVGPGKAAEVAEEIVTRAVEVVCLEGDGEDEAIDQAALARRADELEARLEQALGQSESFIPELIHCCLATGQIRRAQRWRTAALAVYNHHGLYEDALFFGEPLVEDLDLTTSGERTFSRWHVISGLFNALVALGQPERAYQLVYDEALLKIDDPKDLVSIDYTLAMLHCRFLPNRDLVKAEDYLMKSLALIEETGLEESEKHYLAVFNLNGLAFIRHLQGRVEEAAEICRVGFERLNRHLGDDQYRLHRSVLLYNIAQVHTSTRSYDEAVAYYTAAMEIDPRYSEYYNERGIAYLKMGRVDDAVQDFRRAIELSAPYHEVFTNLGQAHKMLGNAENAIAAYSRALDLDPRQILPLLGRAQAYEMAGEKEAALADYTAALMLDKADAQIWSNRAVLHYECGRIADAVADLDQAIGRASTLPDLYANRAVALTDLGRSDEAIRDYGTYLALHPNAPDRGEVLERIGRLQDGG